MAILAGGAEIGPANFSRWEGRRWRPDDGGGKFEVSILGRSGRLL